MTIDPSEAELRSEPNAPLLMLKFALTFGVRGANDIIENPNKKKIELKYFLSTLLKTELSKSFKIVNSLVHFLP
jgi:hypothetical protein